MVQRSMFSEFYNITIKQSKYINVTKINSLFSILPNFSTFSYCVLSILEMTGKGDIVHTTT